MNHIKVDIKILIYYNLIGKQVIPIKQKTKKRFSLFEYVTFSIQNCCGWTLVYMLLQIVSAIFPTLMISISAMFINAFINVYSGIDSIEVLVRYGSLLLLFVLISYLHASPLQGSV